MEKAKPFAAVSASDYGIAWRSLVSARRKIAELTEERDEMLRLWQASENDNYVLTTKCKELEKTALFWREFAPEDVRDRGPEASYDEVAA